MRFAGAISDAQQTVIGTQTDAWIDRSGSDPRPVPGGSRQRLPHPEALAQEQCLDRLARACARETAPGGFKAVGADATGQCGDATVGDDHAAVATGE